MKPLILRREDPPGDEVVVVRAGEMASEMVRRAATRSLEEVGFLGVSVFAALDLAEEQLCHDELDLVRYGKVRLSNFGRLRREGFAVIPTLARPHFDIVLPDLDDDTLRRLASCFDAPIPNPGRR